MILLFDLDFMDAEIMTSKGVIIYDSIMAMHLKIKITYTSFIIKIIKQANTKQSFLLHRKQFLRPFITK